MNKSMSLRERAQLCTNVVSKKLLRLMEDKESNLSVAADVTQSEQLLELADTLGPHLCVFKTHIDILEDFTPAVVEELQSIAKHHGFLIFEDRKFADIGNTVKHQFADGIYRIADWADIINAHPVPGPGIIDGLASGASKKPLGLLLLAQMSSRGSLANGKYTEQCVTMAREHSDKVMGFIAQQSLTAESDFICMTPGINLDNNGDKLGQQYTSPEQAIVECGTDVIIVGRGIVKASRPADAAYQYQKVGWRFLKSRIE